MNKNKFIFALSLLIAVFLGSCSKEAPLVEPSTNQTGKPAEDTVASQPKADTDVDLDSFTPSTVNDSLALVAIYRALGGADWKYSFWTKSPLRYWEGVQLTTIDGIQRVTSLELHGNQVKGQIPAHIKMLTELRRLLLTDSHNLTGSIVDQVYDLKKLRVLDFRFTELSGELSPRIGQLSELDTLVLWKSQFEASTLKKDENGKDQQVVNWNPNTVLFSGAIPREIGKLTKLKELNFARAGFQGAIPSEIGNLALVTRLDLSENRLSGTIPASFGNLKNLIWTALAHNQLTGQIPSEICNASSLQTFIVSYNLLTGVIPTGIGNLAELRYFGIENNSISGTLPKSLENNAKLGLLYAGNNQLSGEIPSELGRRHPMLVGVYLENNNLTGSVPDIVGNTVSTGVWSCMFYAHGNRLSGNVPNMLMRFPDDARKYLLPQQTGFGFDNLK